MWKLMLAVVVAAAGLGGCSAGGPGPTEGGVVVSAGEYAAAFEAARDTLRERRYLLERVDAPQGLITTQARSEPGLAKLWDAPPGFDQASEDLFQRQQRVVRIAFVPRGQSVERFPATDPMRDLLGQPVETVMVVKVGVERIHRPGMRYPVGAIHMGTQTIDPELEKQGMMPRYVVALRDDPALAGELEREIMGRVGAMSRK